MYLVYIQNSIKTVYKVPQYTDMYISSFSFSVLFFQRRFSVHKTSMQDKITHVRICCYCGFILTNIPFANTQYKEK